MRFFVSMAILLFSVSASAQYSRFYFRNPLGIPMYLIANFGEVRNNHYHMGLDLRTQQRENLPVYAAADGYISRITIEAGSYGKCIYITHPNGYTSLYAHLNKFYPVLQQFVEHKQYHDEQWEQDIRFPKGQFIVAKGQYIALSGATGAVEGPHLHFEVRDTKTGNNINPLFLGFPVKDELQPFIYKLFMYDRSYSTYSVDPSGIKIKGAKGKYITKDSIIQTGSQKISFGVSAEDIANGSGFRFGIYGAELWVDSVMQFSFKLREFNYEDSRYVNASIDYKKWATSKTPVQHLSRLPGNKLSIYEGLSDGIIELKDTLPHNISIVVTDAAANESVLNFRVQWNPALFEQKFFTQDRVKLIPNQPNNYSQEGISLNFPATAIYDTVGFYLAGISTGYNNLPVYQLHNTSLPLHDDYTIKIRADGDQDNHDKVVMRLSAAGTFDVVKPTFSDRHWYEGNFHKFGILVLMEDSVPPTITPNGWKDSAVFGKSGSISVTVKDALSYVTSFRAELDGKWLMFERKGNTYTYHFDEYCSIGNHQLKIMARDLVGNEIARNYNFELKEKLPVKKKAAKKNTKNKNGNTSKRRR